MRALLLVLLVGSALSQTTRKPSVFQQLGDVFSSTFESLTDAFGSYLKAEGQSLLNNLLPSLAGEFLQGGLWSLIDTLIHPDGRNATSKREVDEVAERLLQRVQLVLHNAEARAEDIKQALKALTAKVVAGQLTLAQYQQLLPEFQKLADELLATLREDVLAEVHKIFGNKRQLLDLTLVTNILKGLETQGQAVVGQVLQELQALANPGNLLALLTDVAKKLGLTSVLEPLTSLTSLIG